MKTTGSGIPKWCIISLEIGSLASGTSSGLNCHASVGIFENTQKCKNTMWNMKTFLIDAFRYFLLLVLNHLNTMLQQLQKQLQNMAADSCHVTFESDKPGTFMFYLMVHVIVA